MELYMMNRQHGRMILESVKHGPLMWPTIEDNGVTRPRKYSELTLVEAIQADCDVKATNIILQGLSLEVYALCTKPKRKQDDAWFKDKVLLVQAQANGQILHEEELAFLADPGIIEAQTIHMLTKLKFVYDHTAKQALGFQNPFYLKKAQQLEPKLYNGNVLKNTYAIMIPNSEETILLAEESRSKILLKQQDPMVLEKKVNTKPVHYAALNQLSQDFEKGFVPIIKLSAEQAFWPQNSMNYLDPRPSCRPTKVKVLKELPKASMDNSVSNQSALNFDQYFELNELKAQLQEKDMVIMNLKERIKSLSGNMNEDKVKKDIDEIETINIELDYRVKLKAKAFVDNGVTTHTIAPEMRKIDMEPLVPRLLNIRTTHSNYLRLTQEQAVILREVVEQGKSQSPLNNSLNSACKYTKRIQELLIIINQTCHSINNSSEKLVVVTLKNRDKRVRFNEPVTSSRNTTTKTASSTNLVFNKPKLSSTRVKLSTSASESQPSGNTKKDRIQQPPRSTQNYKVKAHPRTVKSSLKNKNCAVEPKGPDLYVLNVINDVIARLKSKSVKKTSKRKVWKPTARITTSTEVPPWKPTVLEADTTKPVVTLVYSRKPRKSKTNVPVSKPKIIKFLSANNKEPSESWGSIVFDVLSSSLDECRLSKLFFGIWTPAAPSI
nr:hypothetical protein [Tanacetum cinerariifolium]